MGDAAGDDLNGEAFGIADCLIPGPAIAHDPRKLEGFRDPAPIFLPVELDRQIHPFMILPGVAPPDRMTRNVRPALL